jgi:hypothetical protein
VCLKPFSFPPREREWFVDGYLFRLLLRVHGNSVMVELSKSCSGTIVVFAKMVFVEEKVAIGPKQPILVTLNEALTNIIPVKKVCPGLDTTKTYSCWVHIHIANESPLCNICNNENWNL